MSALPPEILAPTPLTQEDIHRLIGALFLEIDVLRRHNAALKQYIESLHATAIPNLDGVTAG